MSVTYSEPSEYSELFPMYIQKIQETSKITTVFDLGSNVGAFINLINRVAPEVKQIIGFEPDIDNFNFIKKHNNGRLVLHNVGIFYGVESCSVNGIGDNNIGGYMVSAIDDEHTKTWGSSIMTYKEKEFILKPLENYTSNEKLDLIKIDVEASEYNILDNSTDLKLFEWIIIEFHNHNYEYYVEYLKNVLSTHRIIHSTDCHFLLQKK